MSAIHALLNPAPSSEPQPQQRSPPSHAVHSPTQSAASSWSRGSTHATSGGVTTSFETASALSALATSAPSSYTHAYAPPMTSHPISREPYSPVDGYSHARRTSTFGSIAAPIEPSPAADRPQPPHSPITLDQYHHGSKSPEDQLRRHSLFSASTEVPRLAPIQSLTSALGEKINGQPPRDNAYGHDTSSYTHTSAHQTSVGGDNTALSTSAENREHGVVRDTPVTKHVREPSPLKNDAKMSSEPKQLSPGAVIKSEDSPAPVAQMGSPTRTTPNGTQGTPPLDMDPETKKLVEKLKNEHGVRGARAKSSIEAIPAFEPPQPVLKKRAAPKPSVAATKKGTAKKPPPKKRKVEAVDAASPASAATRGSPTPSRKKGSKTNTPALGSSPAAEDPFVDDGDDDAASIASGDDVYCICRKGDDHSWMIACDGGCEDWFHGKCVQIREEDGDLIDRYICPNCAKKSGAATTWKPMCRRDGCRKPARVSKSNASKYCSDYCGELFMSRMAEKSNVQAGGNDQKKKTSKNRRKSVFDNASNAADDSDDEDMGPRGGPLRPGEIKALATCAKDVDSFRSLGDGVLSPPPTASPSVEKFPNGAPDGVDSNSLPLSYALQPSETDRINAIADEKDVLRQRRQLLKDKEKFVSMTREQHTRYADREGIKVKDVCGYDRRLGWDETQFERWRNSVAGKTAFRLGTLDVAENGDEETEAQDNEPQVNGDVEMPDADEEKSSEKEFFCTKKRCQRHHGWQKLALHDVRNAESELANEMRKLDKEEREIRERAMLRWRKETGANRVEGTVEVVG